MNNFVEAARLYKSLGMSVVPIGSNKSPTIKLKPYQSQVMTDRQIAWSFSPTYVHGIAIVCGTISNNLEVIDIDCKYDLTGSLVSNFVHSFMQADPNLFPQLVVGSTRNHGIHLYYRCETVGRDEILAQRPLTDREKAVDPELTSKTLIETRANGGYVLAPPSPGYRIIRRALSDISTITPFQRDILFKVARSFNTFVEPKRVPFTIQYTGTADESPLNDYDARGDVVDLLALHGWIVFKTTSQRTHLRRPGDTDHKSSGNFHHVYRKFIVFTPNSVFIPKKPYRPHAVFAILECQGDFRLAAKRLVAAGFGIPYRRMM